ncbi:hypothetical protein RRG08_065663 [Elysia crispata]|uniref:Uncharacterized protein n=1 Tax=Elysia crispata TaxID=231223 RepID=A0AAE1DE26_9GAST|nr:hypothetical protein RRG08_065663 [Elysia crispata]
MASTKQSAEAMLQINPDSSLYKTMLLRSKAFSDRELIGHLSFIPGGVGHVDLRLCIEVTRPSQHTLKSPPIRFAATVL